MPDSTEHIRRADAGDVDAIVDLVAQLRRDERSEGVDRGAVAAAVRSSLESSASAVLVAGFGDAVVGFAVVHWVPFPMLAGTEAYISDLIVDSGHRGRGLGRRLLAVVEEEARRRGCIRLMLNNRIASEAFRRGFYPKLGFRLREDFAGLVKALR